MFREIYNDLYNSLLYPDSKPLTPEQNEKYRIQMSKAKRNSKIRTLILILLAALTLLLFNGKDKIANLFGYTKEETTLPANTVVSELSETNQADSDGN